MFIFYPIKSFDQQVKEAEMHLRKIEKRYGKDSNMWKSRAKALRIQKKNYRKIHGPEIVSEPLAEGEGSHAI